MPTAGKEVKEAQVGYPLPVEKGLTVVLAGMGRTVLAVKGEQEMEV
jgi:hypothetical protein